MWKNRNRPSRTKFSARLIVVLANRVHFTPLRRFSRSRKILVRNFKIPELKILGSKIPELKIPDPKIQESNIQELEISEFQKILKIQNILSKNILKNSKKILAS